ncbi:MAG: hypothetical protein AAGJ81_03725 [Verrucomicrobiota bacterium]
MGRSEFSEFPCVIILCQTYSCPFSIYWLTLLAALFWSPHPAHAEEESNPTKEERNWMITVFGGQLTDNVWEEAVNPEKTDWIDSYIAGVAVARDFAHEGRFDFGWELQMVVHFGDQNHLEGNGLLYSRYEMPSSWRIWKSAAFGLGLSYATDVPESEVDRGGDSTNTLVYWMAELEFYLPPDHLTLIVRLHHRSDAYGLFPDDTGTNAFVAGLRWRF